MVLEDFEDMMGTGSIAGGPEIRSSDGTKHFNIDDPNYGLEGMLGEDGKKPAKLWAVDPLSLGNLPELKMEPKTCEQDCADKMAVRRKKCDILRKRVAEALKKAGCPSKITGYAKKSKCAPCSTKTKAAKKSTASKTARRR